MKKCAMLLMMIFVVSICGCSQNGVNEVEEITAEDFMMTDGSNEIHLDVPFTQESSYGELLSTPEWTEFYARRDDIVTNYMQIGYKYKDIGIETANFNYDVYGRSKEIYYIRCIYTTTDKYATRRGIRVGNQMEEVLNAYGECTVRYEYGVDGVPHGEDIAVTGLSYEMGVNGLNFYFNDKNEIIGIAIDIYLEDVFESRFI